MSNTYSSDILILLLKILLQIVRVGYIAMRLVKQDLVFALIFGIDNIALSANESCVAKLFIVALAGLVFLRNQSNKMRRQRTRNTPQHPVYSCMWGMGGFDQIKRQPVCLTHPHRNAQTETAAPIQMQRHWHCNLKTSS